MAKRVRRFLFGMYGYVKREHSVDKARKRLEMFMQCLVGGSHSCVKVIEELKPTKVANEFIDSIGNMAAGCIIGRLVVSHVYLSSRVAALSQMKST